MAKPPLFKETNKRNVCREFSVDNSWGIASLRQCAGFPASELDIEDDSSYFAPLGALVVRLDIKTRQRRSSFQAHGDLITCMLYNRHAEIILTASYNGEIRLWTKSWELLFFDKAVFPGIYFAAWSKHGEAFLVCGGGKDSFIAEYSVKRDANKILIVSLSWEFEGKSATSNTGDVNHSGCKQEKPVTPAEDADVKPNSSTYVQQKDGYDAAVFTSQNYVIALLQRYNQKYSEVHLISESGELMKSQILDPLGDVKAAILCVTPCHNGVFAVGFQGGIFLVLHEQNLSVLSILQAAGSPQITLWDGDYLLAVSYLSGIFSWWTVDGKLVHELRGGPTDSIIKLDWVPSHKGVWVGGIMSLHYVTFHYGSPPERFPNKLEVLQKLAFHEVTGCGIAMNSQDLVASGDFTGNVFVWEKGQTNPVFRTKYENSIRCLSWNSLGLFIGSLDGNLLRWNPESSSDPQVILTSVGGILTMSWSHDHTRLAIGLDTGHLCVYNFAQHLGQPVEFLNFRAHSVTQDEEVVGTEVWSVCWSPCDSMMATASEDQTACVWSSGGGGKLVFGLQSYHITDKNLVGILPRDPDKILTR